MTRPVNTLSIVPGMTVFVEPASRRTTRPFLYLEGTVVSVGRKFFYVKCENYGYTLKFSLANGQHCTDYGIEHYAYLSLDDLRRQKERNVMLLAIRERLIQPEAPSYGEIKQIYDVLDLPELGEILTKKK